MLRAALMTLVGFWAVARGPIAIASPAPAEHAKGGAKDEHKAAPAAKPAESTTATEKAGSKPHAPAGGDKAAGAAAAGEKLPGKMPALNTVVETPASRAKKEPGKTEDGSPTLNVSALREEMRRGGVEEDRPGTKRYAEKLEQLTKDLNKAREGLRDEAARLEALLAKGDGGGAGAGDGETGKKLPTPLDTVAKAMRGMKPEQAAPVVARMDKKLAADVLQRMPAADAGKVMGQLKPETAAELAAEIASRRPGAEARR